MFDKCRCPALLLRDKRGSVWFPERQGPYCRVPLLFRQPSCLALSLSPLPQSCIALLGPCKMSAVLPGSLTQFISPLNNLEINNVATGERLKSHLVSKPKLSFKYLQHQKEMRTQRASAWEAGRSTQLLNLLLTSCVRGSLHLLLQFRE